MKSYQKKNKNNSLRECNIWETRYSMKDLSNGYEYVENSHRLIQEEFRNKRNRLQRKITLLDEIKTTMEGDFVLFHGLLQKLDFATKRYIECNEKFRDATTRFTILQGEVIFDESVRNEKRLTTH